MFDFFECKLLSNIYKWNTKRKFYTKVRSDDQITQNFVRNPKKYQEKPTQTRLSLHSVYRKPLKRTWRVVKVGRAHQPPK